jgi:hypothetical protein
MNNDVYRPPALPLFVEMESMFQEMHRANSISLGLSKEEAAQMQPTVARYFATLRAIKERSEEIEKYEVFASGPGTAETSSVYFPNKTPLWEVAKQIVALTNGISVPDLLKAMKYFGREATPQALASAFRSHPESFRILDAENGKVIQSGERAFEQVPQKPIGGARDEELSAIDAGNAVKYIGVDESLLSHEERYRLCICSCPPPGIAKV